MVTRVVHGLYLRGANIGCFSVAPAGLWQPRRCLGVTLRSGKGDKVSMLLLLLMSFPHGKPHPSEQGEQCRKRWEVQKTMLPT